MLSCMYMYAEKVRIFHTIANVTYNIFIEEIFLENVV